METAFTTVLFIFLNPLSVKTMEVIFRVAEHILNKNNRRCNEPFFVPDSLNNSDGINSNGFLSFIENIEDQTIMPLSLKFVQ